MSNSGNGVGETGTTWQNWSDTIEFKPSYYSKPTSYDQLVSVLQQAAQASKPVRVVGSGHSWSLGAVPGAQPYSQGASVDGYLIDVSGLNPKENGGDSYLKAYYFQDTQGSNYVAVPPGTAQGWMAKNAANKNDFFRRQSNRHPDLAFGSMGPAPDITLGGFIANGCHGTGWEQPPTADYLVAVEVLTVNASGQVEPRAFTLSQELATLLQSKGVTKANPEVSTDAMNALRASLGAFGVITRMVFQLAPLFHVASLDESADVSLLFPDNGDPTHLQTLVLSSDYVEIFWFPYNRKLWVKRFKQMDAPVQHVGKVVDFNWIVSQLAALTQGKLGEFFANRPKFTPITLKSFFWGLELLMNRELENLDFSQDFNPASDPIVEVQDAYLYQTKYFTNIIDMEYTVPIPARSGGGYDFTNVMTAWKQVVQQIDQMRSDSQYPISLNVHLRFIKNSGSFLSPARQGDSGTHTCYIEYISFSEQLDPYAQFTQAVGQQWEQLGGLPHWGKIFQLIPNVYSRVNQTLNANGVLAPFLAQHESLDPKGTFMNNFLSQILLGTGAPSAEAARAQVRRPAVVAAEETPVSIQRFRVGGPTRGVPPRLPSTEERVKSERGCRLAHEPRESVAALVDENGEGHFMSYEYDPATGEVVYRLLTRSKFLSPREIFSRVGEVLRESSDG